MGKFTLFTGQDGQIYFNLKATNGEIICQSEGYVSKQGAENGIASVRRNAPDAEIDDCTDAAPND